MAMGICSDDDLKQELERLRKPVNPNPTNPTNLINHPPKPTAEVVEKKTRGWNGGRDSIHTDIPDTLRRVIGDTVIESGNRGLVARAFGVSESSVSAYKNGATSTASYHRSDKELKAHMREKRVEVSDKARMKLMGALDYITDDKLQAAKARDLAGIAKDMSAVIQNMESRETEELNQTNIIFYSPKPKTEEDYVTIQVNE